MMYAQEGLKIIEKGYYPKVERNTEVKGAQTTTRRVNRLCVRAEKWVEPYYERHNPDRLHRRELFSLFPNPLEMRTREHAFVPIN